MTDTTSSSQLDEQQVWAALRDVPDPEMPVISLVDMGVVHHVQVDAVNSSIRVEITPTFAGCPALARMCDEIQQRLLQLAAHVEVCVTMQQPWTSDLLSEEAREKLRSIGIAPPPRIRTGQRRSLPLLMSQPPACPHCGSQQTTLENAFGPTPCRAIAYCTACLQPFEAFKPI
ncbi:MAG: phenylacetate-CoA oxygenase subunit PaaJ [Ktedonobacteraceae bacterium]|nr:phenylacetate-CoA oxygenase subunit PaaJ [Ktedonobacteraceae bacterium]